MESWIHIGAKVVDTVSGTTEEITDISSNSVEVTRTRVSEKGINCKNWFEYSKFMKLFDKIIE